MFDWDLHSPEMSASAAGSNRGSVFRVRSQPTELGMSISGGSSLPIGSMSTTSSLASSGVFSLDSASDGRCLFVAFLY